MSDIEIQKICKKYKIVNYTIVNELVNVNGDVDLFKRRLTKLPLKFGEVTGSFSCSHNELTSLEGSPTYVGDYFSCAYNQLISLMRCSSYVGAEFSCRSNRLTSLEGSPTYVGGNFRCQYNHLTDLKGCPDEVEGDFDCSDNRIYTLEGLLFKRINNIYIGFNPISNLYSRYKLADIDYREFFIEADVIRPPKVKGDDPIINKDRMDWFTQTYGLKKYNGNEGRENYILEL